MPGSDYYHLLGVDARCSEAEIETAYRRRLAQYLAGDGAYRAGDQKAVESLNRAYLVLTDPEQRRRYDDELSRVIMPGGTADSPAAQPVRAGAAIPDWLKETEEFAKATGSSGEGEISEWMVELIHEAEKRKRASGDQRTIRVIIFISLLVLLTITLLVTLMVLTR